jgi:hypothetical protein
MVFTATILPCFTDHDVMGGPGLQLPGGWLKPGSPLPQMLVSNDLRVRSSCCLIAWNPRHDWSDAAGSKHRCSPSIAHVETGGIMPC